MKKSSDNMGLYVPRDVFTALPNGDRVSKSDLRMEACGTLDELNSYVGLLISMVSPSCEVELHTIQRKLFAVGAYAMGEHNISGLPVSEDIDGLKQRISYFQREIEPLKGFILPGGTRAAAIAHVCRTVCRRAERVLVRLKVYGVVPYINRLSTYFFYLALYLNKIHNTDEIKL